MGDLIYVVFEGEFEIVCELVDGGEELVKIVVFGDYFGEIGVLFYLLCLVMVWVCSDVIVVGYMV